MNSLSGLIARFQYHSIDILAFLQLIVAVLIGGYLGSFMGPTKFSPKTMQKILGTVIIVAIIFVTRKIMVI
jgi:uncharacterized membrane protein YfcA